MKLTIKRNLKTIINSVLVLCLIVMVALMMGQIHHLQGTARVINYAGLVRGATQREVKLEITGNANDDLIQYLDDILSGLKYADGHYDLVRLDDTDYQLNLDVQIALWQKLKAEIYAVRERGYEATDIVALSEQYFALADDTVDAAERYSETIAVKIRQLEILSAADMLVLLFLLIQQTIAALKIAKRNKILEQRAYIDLHTGLPNKSRCEELLHSVEFIESTIACAMFDLNNLKYVNDNLGHSAGDQLIVSFARILRNVVPAKDFVGRYGGDEFIVVLYDTDAQGLQQVQEQLRTEVDRFNQHFVIHGANLIISYAQGWALSSDYEQCTLRTLLDKADKHMYENKQRAKAADLAR